MTLTGLVYGPMSAVLPELFPTNVRYSGSGVSFNIASVLGAAVAPFIATWLTVHYGVGHVGLYLVAMALLSLGAQWLMPETRTTSLDTPDTTGVSGERAAEPQSAGSRTSELSCRWARMVFIHSIVGNLLCEIDSTAT
jgi:MFS family permease